MKTLIITIFILTAIFLGYQQVRSMDQNMGKPMTETAANTKTAVFAGGCFWCTESDFEKLPGVIDAVSGYTGGHVANPTYHQVSEGGTGHVEAVEVIYDPSKVSYEQLLDWFWRHVDPTDPGGQFVDRGSQYRSVIFYASEEEHRMAEASEKALVASGRFDKPIVTDILPLGPFYKAEEYHQNYYKKNPIRYHWYRSGSGRDQFLAKVWGTGKSDMKDQTKANETDSKIAVSPGKDSDMQTGMMSDKEQSRVVTPKHDAVATFTRPDDDTLRRELTPLQYKVTQQEGTEAPFNNAYWDNHRQGIYVDVVSGEALFSSTDKFDSGTGWPSFTRPLVPENIVEKKDRRFFMVRIEVRSKHGDSHLGHVFDDGPQPTGLRYCINSAALRFIPKADLTKDGYGKFAASFK